MVMEYPYEQRSPEWHAVRNGKITGSKFEKIIQSKNPKGDWTQAMTEFLLGLAAERITGEHEIDGYISSDMIWGTSHEPEAMALINDVTGFNFRECGFFENTAFPGCGSSPDGIDDKAKKALEIKCPSSKMHLKYLRDSSELWKKYKWQAIGEMIIPEMESVILCSYDPRFPIESRLVVFNPEDLQEDIDYLGKRLLAANEVIKGLLI